MTTLLLIIALAAVHAIFLRVAIGADRLHRAEWDDLVARYEAAAARVEEALRHARP